MRPRVIGLMIPLVLAACGDDENVNPDNTELQQSLEIQGTWTSNFGSTEVITDVSWSDGFTDRMVVSYDNTSNRVVTQNPSDDAFFPDKFNLVVWTDVQEDAFYYCTVTFGLETAELADGIANIADPQDPDNSGCGGFPWTQLTLVP